MGRGTSYNDIKAAIEMDERLTRAQAHSLLEYAQTQVSRVDRFAHRITELERLLKDVQTQNEVDKEFTMILITKWNSMIHMLHAFLERNLYDEEGIDTAEQYRQALEEKFSAVK